MLKFDKVITKATWWWIVHVNYWHLVLGGLVIKILPIEKTYLSRYILALVKPLPLTEMAELSELPNWEKLDY